MRRTSAWSLLILAPLLVSSTLHAQDREPANRLAREIFQQLVEINTTDSVGNVTSASDVLPQNARANVNCRIFPSQDPEEVRKTLLRVAADPKVSVTVVAQTSADGKPVPVVSVPPSPLLPELTAAMEKNIPTLRPGLPVLATMSTGATDGKYLRIAGIPTYGIACMFYELNDNRAHGKDERLGVEDFYDGLEFNYRFLKMLSSLQ